MTMGLDTIAAIIRDIGNGVAKRDTAIPLDAEASAYWDESEKRMANPAPGTVFDVPYDGNDDQYLAHLYHRRLW